MTESDAPQPLGLPSASDAPKAQLHDTIQFEQLGPIVVRMSSAHLAGQFGWRTSLLSCLRQTMSRIPNWHDMTEMEKERTVRILSRRNKERTERLRAEQASS